MMWLFMQPTSQHNVSDDKDKAITCHFKHCVINHIINDENQYDVSNRFFKMQSGLRDFVTKNGCSEELLLHLERCKGTVWQPNTISKRDYCKL
jgi:hypothetical protein